MKIKFFDQDICDDRFYLMIVDSFDAFVEKDKDSAIVFAEFLKEDISNIIDEVTEDWIRENNLDEEGDV